MTGQERDGAYLTTDELDTMGELTDTEIYEGELEAGVHETELRDGETTNPDVAAEEGLTWVPPIHPPVVADAGSVEGARIAAGFGTDAFDDPYDADHHGRLVPLDDEFSERIREALLADSASSRYADSLIIGTRGGKVVVRGVVDDIDDTDNVAAVIGNVTGVTEVVDELEVTGITD